MQNEETGSALPFGLTQQPAAVIDDLVVLFGGGQGGRTNEAGCLCALLGGWLKGKR